MVPAAIVDKLVGEYSGAMQKGDILIDGVPATREDLTHVALVNYGAYTSFRVEDGGVRGLDLHLERLEAGALELFGDRPPASPPDPARSFILW